MIIGTPVLKARQHIDRYVGPMVPRRADEGGSRRRRGRDAGERLAPAQVVHCHLLIHEDYGMMSAAESQRGFGPSRRPALGRSSSRPRRRRDTPSDDPARTRPCCKIGLRARSRPQVDDPRHRKRGDARLRSAGPHLRLRRLLHGRHGRARLLLQGRVADGRADGAAPRQKRRRGVAALASRLPRRHGRGPRGCHRLARRGDAAATTLTGHDGR